MGEIKVVHYLNQFFAGVGGEEKTDTPVAIQKMQNSKFLTR